MPTTPAATSGIDDEESRIQVEALDKNAEDFGIDYYGVEDVRQGIVHIIGPEQGWTLPGMTIVCGDSHTATHGAFGALAHGIGTSRGRARARHPDADPAQGEEHEGRDHRARSGPGVTAKDITLSIIGATGTAGGTGHVIEYCGEAIRALSMEGRMTVCNMAIEGGARAGLIAPDETTFAYVQGPPARAEGRGRGRWRWPGGGRSSPTRARTSTRRSCSTRRGHRPGRDLGHLARGRAADHRRRAAARRTSRAARSRPRGARSTTWA